MKTVKAPVDNQLVHFGTSFQMWATWCFILTHRGREKASTGSCKTSTGSQIYKIPHHNEPLPMDMLQQWHMNNRSNVAHPVGFPNLSHTCTTIPIFIIIKSSRYTLGDFMFCTGSYATAAAAGRRRRRSQTFVHAITFEQHFGFLPLLAQLLA